MRTKVPKLRADTRALLNKKVEAVGGIEAAAVALSVSSSTIEGIIAGRRGLGMYLGWRIECVFGIRMQAWFEPVEMERIPFKRVAG